MEEDAKFIRVSETNKDELARLLIEAKGPGRTMKQFAIECEVNPSTFSRIVNKSIKGASSDKLIKAIAEHANPESGVTLDALMGAHGMARIYDSSTVVKTSAQDIEKRFKDAVLYQLQALGDLMGHIENMRFRVGTSFRVQPDLLVRSKSIRGDRNLWAFDLVLPQSAPYNANGERSKADVMRSTRMYGRHILENMGKVLPQFYGDEGDGELLGKFSYVLMDREGFDYVTSEFANYQVPFNMSFILFNYDKEILEKEFILKNPDGKVSSSIINEF